VSLLIPLYVHPAEDPGSWHRLITAADRTYGVVVNPANGPGDAPDPAFGSVAAEIAGDALRHREWYGADGCFLDRVSSAATELSAYRAVVRGLRRQGSSLVVLNPGVHPAPGYARLADLVVTFEGSWSAYVSAFSRPDWTLRHSPERFCHLVYGVPEALVPLAVRTARERGAAVSGPVTGEPPNPWALLTPVLTGAE
jgi:hypothetical protein